LSSRGPLDGGAHPKKKTWHLEMGGVRGRRKKTPPARQGNNSKKEKEKKPGRLLEKQSKASRRSEAKGVKEKENPAETTIETCSGKTSWKKR